VAWFLGQSLLFIVLAFVLGLLVGWLIWGRRRVVQMSFSSGTGSAPSASSASSSGAAVPAPAAAPAIESDDAALDSTVDYGASSTVDEREREPALTGAGGSAAESPTMVLPYGTDVFRSERAAQDGEPSSEAASADARASADSNADTVVVGVADEPEAAAPAVDDEVLASEPEPVSEPQPVAIAEPEPVAKSEPVAVAAVEPVAAAVEPAAEPASVAEAAPEPAPEPVLVAAADSPVDGPAAAGTSATATTAEPEPDDDLKRIEGIGPKMAAALNRAGIRTFRQLSEADEPALRAAIEAAGLRFAPSLVTWARQARLLADGDEHGFNVLTKQLTAGRDARRR
jgi:predicted flap endonuclease-1-like 5' DNA nuclease